MEQHTKAACESTLAATYHAGILRGQLPQGTDHEDDLKRKADEQLLCCGIDDTEEGGSESTIEEDAQRVSTRWSEGAKGKQMVCTWALIVSREWLKRRHTQLQRECRMLEDHVTVTQGKHAALLHEYEKLETRMQAASQQRNTLLVSEHARARRELLLCGSVPYAAWGTAWFCMWTSLLSPINAGMLMYMWTCPLIAMGCVCCAISLAMAIPRWTVSRTERLHRFYAKWNPEKANSLFVRDKCAKYARNIDEMFRVLSCKYGPEPNDQPFYQLLSFAAIVVVVTVWFLTNIYGGRHSTFPSICMDPNKSTLH